MWYNCALIHASKISTISDSCWSILQLRQNRFGHDMPGCRKALHEVRFKTTFVRHILSRHIAVLQGLQIAVYKFCTVLFYYFRNQIREAFTVLTAAQELLEDSDKNKIKILDASTRFYTVNLSS